MNLLLVFLKIIYRIEESITIFLFTILFRMSVTDMFIKNFSCAEFKFTFFALLLWMNIQFVTFELVHSFKSLFTLATLDHVEDVHMLGQSLLVEQLGTQGALLLGGLVDCVNVASQLLGA